jgi:hypothetical protein
LTAMYTRTTAQIITTQKTAVFTFELMNSPSAGQDPSLAWAYRA